MYSQGPDSFETLVPGLAIGVYDGSILVTDADEPPSAKMTNFTVSVEGSIPSVPAIGDHPVNWLGQNLPNPFRRHSTTTVPYSLASPGRVEIRIVDISGRIIKTILQEAEEGENRVLWDGTDHSGRSVPSGVYFLRMRANDFVGQKKMLIID